MKVWLKFCGICRPEDYTLAVSLGADAIGLICAPDSARFVTDDELDLLAKCARGNSMLTLVFQDAAETFVHDRISIANPDLLQFHGNENAEFAESFGLPYIKATREAAQIGSLRSHPNANAWLMDDPIYQRNIEFQADCKRFILAGQLTTDNVQERARSILPFGIDVSRGIEAEARKKDPLKMIKFDDLVRELAKYMSYTYPDENGFFGNYGGQFIPETLVAPCQELAVAYHTAVLDPEFNQELSRHLHDFGGRPTPLYHAERLSKDKGFPVFLKREDLLHTGAHKLNNALGQALLAKRLNKPRIIAETGAGQHGVATATVCARFGLECIVYMGAKDMERQAPNVARMKMLGASVRPVTSGTQTLKDATSEAIRDWVTNCRDTFYLIGSVVGPHPYPLMVREFQKVIGEETREQCASRGIVPQVLLACVGGGSNAIGFFYPYIDESLQLIGVEAGGEGDDSIHHAAALTRGTPGVLHGSLSYVLQNADGQIIEAHSISAGLDYPGIGPEHSFLFDNGRVQYVRVSDEEALAAARELAQLEGIIPALESAHALAHLAHLKQVGFQQTAIVCLSGRGDKDMGIYDECI